VTLAGVLTPIENVLTDVLTWFHDTVGLSWAWSIVALVVVVRVLLVPLAIKQIHSMQSLQLHAPEMRAIQQRYKNDRQRQSEELMKFYRENKINPYASCLPIVLQIPIFIGLFFVLRDFEEEIFCDPSRGDFCDPQGEVLSQFHSALEWLNLVDITENTSTGWGPLLLVVYVVSQLTSTWLMSTQMQSNAQRYLLMALPVLFIPFILSFPSGLMIYWLTTNLWTTGQGIVTRRLVPKRLPPPKKSSRTPPKEPPAQPEPDGAGEDKRPARSPSGARSAPRRVKKKRGGRPRR
jgi:YidC/Oxa1 family membrane protein insertase